MAEDESGDYPYKLDEALAAGVPAAVAYASRDVVEARHVHYSDPSDENYHLRVAAEGALRAVLVTHRSGRLSLGVTAEVNS